MKIKLCTLVLFALQIHFSGRASSAEDFVAHEWGTFTSVQGADGIQMEWNPLITSELPNFVYDAQKPPGSPARHLSLSGTKSAFRTLQRMETPVIYFYSDTERAVDV